jgi:hypothetical protein
MKRWFGIGLMFASVIVLVLAATGTGQAQKLLRSPQAGDIFKEFSRANMGYSEWRVTDPAATNPGAQANLPNAVLYLNVPDLQHAIRAEAVIDVWGGHAGTSNKRIRFNNNSWISVPELRTPPGSGECWLSQYNAVVDVPLYHLSEGSVSVEGTCDGQICYDFGWGQWGFNGIVLRVYYDSTKTHPTGTITSVSQGGTLGENPTITVNASSPFGISRVDFLGYYDAYDTDGDGVYLDWHYNYHRSLTETVMQMHNHIGTATSAPWSVTWNTARVPDQDLGGITLGAIIRDNNGVMYMAPYVEDVSLVRANRSVRLYKPYNMPQQCELRVGATKWSNFTVPDGTSLADATEATFWLSSFNGLDITIAPGEDHWVKVNSHTLPLFGDNHFYALSVVTFPASALVVGENTVEYHSESSGTGMMFHWPGPGIIVQYAGSAYGSPRPAAPALASPANNSPTQPLSFAFRWRKAWTATSYRLQVSADSTFSTVSVDDSTITDTTKTVSGLSPFTKYFWRVRAKNAAMAGDFSPAWSFTTFVLLPTHISPANNSTGIALSPTLQWRAVAGATKYYLQLGIDPSFAGGLIIDDSTKTDTTRAVTGLSYNTPYYWHVAAKTAPGFGPFTSAWTFTTLVPVPGQVTLASPANNSDLTSDSITFTWRRQNGATKYWIEVGFDSLFTFKQDDTTVTDTAKGFKLAVNNHTYFWKVRAGNSGGWGAFSAMRRINVTWLGVNDVAGLPKEIQLHANYPNPFNPSTRIAFDLPREMHVTLEVYSILGERVAVLVDETRGAGYHQVQFDASGLASGVYLYRMTANEVTLLKKMVLMK